MAKAKTFKMPVSLCGDLGLSRALHVSHRAELGGISSYCTFPNVFLELLFGVVTSLVGFGKNHKVSLETGNGD